jgi:hypothetical protein
MSSDSSYSIALLVFLAVLLVDSSSLVSSMAELVVESSSLALLMAEALMCATSARAEASTRPCHTKADAHPTVRPTRRTIHENGTIQT